MKKYLALILICLLGAGAAGCQAVSAAGYKATTDQERLVASARETGSAKEVAEPDAARLTWEGENEEGTVKVSVDAAVSRGAERMPIVRASSAGFSGEEIANMVAALYPGGDALVCEKGEGVLTRKEIQDLIDMYQEWLDEGTAEEKSLYTEEELRAEISNLKAELRTAPETESEPAYEPFDGTMTPSERDGVPCETVSITDKTRRSTLSVETAAETAPVSFGYVFYERDGIDAAYRKVRSLAGPEDAGEAGISYADALRICEDFLEGAGVSDVQAALADVVESGGDYGYAFSFVRSLDGTGAAKVWPLMYPGDSYVVALDPGDQERLQMIVMEDGIHEVVWTMRTDPGEFLADDTEILPAQEAESAFTKLIYAQYAGRASEQFPVRISVDEVVLAPLKTGDENESMFVPHWLWYGAVAQAPDQRGEGPSQIVFAVNALDGTAFQQPAAD